MWYGMVLCGIAWYCVVLYGIVWYCIVWYGIAWYCMLFHSILWHCRVLYGVVVCVSTRPIKSALQSSELDGTKHNNKLQLFTVYQFVQIKEVLSIKSRINFLT